MNPFHLTVLAYIDPGTGSMLLQLLLAGLLASAHILGTRFSSIKAYLLGLVKHNG